MFQILQFFWHIKHIVIFIIIITFNIVNVLNMLVPVMICVLLSQLQMVVFSFSKQFFFLKLIKKENAACCMTRKTESTEPSLMKAFSIAKTVTSKCWKLLA